MLQLVLLIMAAIGVVSLTARTAGEHGRRRALWAALSIGACIAGEICGVVVFGVALRGDPAEFSVLSFFAGMIAPLLCPAVAMTLVYVALVQLPERVPTVAGSSWSVYLVSAPSAQACQLAVEGDRLRLGSVTIDARDIGEIGNDGECVRLAWSEQSALLLPAGKQMTSRERIKWSAGVARRLRQQLRL